MFEVVSFIFALLFFGGPDTPVLEDPDVGVAQSDDPSCYVTNPIVTGGKDSVVLDGCA